MRSIALVLLLVACGTDPAGDDDGMGSGTDVPAFTIVSKEVTLQPGQEVTYCYYFHTPNTEELVIKKWASTMTPGSHHMIMFYGSPSQPADGTLDPSGSCGNGSGFSIPVWVYASSQPEYAVTMPQDDGTGKPLGMKVPPNQAGYFQMHYLNQGDEPLVVTVKLDAYAYAKGTTYTPTAAYITYNSDISIPPNATGHTETETCGIPNGAKFWQVSTHTHKQSVKTTIADGSDMVFLSEGPDAWEHPGVKNWMTMPFYSFGAGDLTYACTYNNPTSNQIVDGQSAQTNEMCMATGYIFPSENPKFCLTRGAVF